MSATTVESPFRLTIPDGFCEIDLAGSPEARAAVLATLTPSFTDAERAPFVAQQEELVERLRSTSAVYAAHIVDVLDGRVFVAVFSVAVISADATSEQVMSAIAARLGGLAGVDEASVVRLPGGSALRVAGEATAADGSDVLQIHAMVPYPEHRHLVICTLRTTSKDGWAQAQQLFDNVTATLSFGPAPHGVSSISAALG